MRPTLAIFAALALALAVTSAGDAKDKDKGIAPAAAHAKHCRGEHGRFIHCVPHPGGNGGARHCRDPKTGKFVRCPHR